MMCVDEGMGQYLSVCIYLSVDVPIGMGAHTMWMCPEFCGI